MQKYQRKQKEKQSLKKDLETNSPEGGFQLKKGKRTLGQVPNAEDFNKDFDLAVFLQGVLALLRYSSEEEGFSSDE